MGSDDSSAFAFRLAQRAGDGADSVRIADALAASWHDMEAALRPILGAGGVAALGARSLSMVAASHPWLSVPGGGGAAAMPSDVDLSALKRRVARQHSAEAVAGSAALLHAFHGLVCSLIGTALSERLLQPARRAADLRPTLQDPPT